MDLEATLRIVERLRVARDAGRTIFIAGNGGSAATATHWVNDLGKATRRSGQQMFRVIGLADNISWFTALANDEGYERVFAGQLENLARPGDVLAVISASGNSPNLCVPSSTPGPAGMTSIGFLGFDGGRLLRLVDEALWVRTPPGEYGLVEIDALRRVRHRHHLPHRRSSHGADVAVDEPSDPRTALRLRRSILAGGLGDPPAAADRHPAQADDRVPRPAVPRVPGGAAPRRRASSACCCFSATSPTSIQDHFGDGSRFGVSIAYSRDAAGRPQTGARVRTARDAIDPTVPAAVLRQLLAAAARPACGDASRRSARRRWSRSIGTPTATSRDNVRLEDEGFVADYDRQPDEAQGCKGVEIGYAILRRDGPGAAAGDGRRSGRGGRLSDARRRARRAAGLSSPTTATTALARSSGCRSRSEFLARQRDGLPGPRRRAQSSPAARPSTSADRRSSSGCPAPATAFGD